MSQLTRFETDQDDLPPTNHHSVIERAVLIALERRFPGLIDEIAADIDAEATQLKIVRLRGPRPAPAAARAADIARRWIEILALARRGT